jgi:hypothetical protein
MYTGGDLFYHLQKNKNFDEKIAKFYAAQILLLVEYLIQNNFCPDIQPEFLLLGSDEYVVFSPVHVDTIDSNYYGKVPKCVFFSVFQPLN